MGNSPDDNGPLMAKRHHYVPVTYLRQFVDANGQLIVFRKDDPERPFRQRPEAMAFERYYYSQIDADGVRDDDSFETLFSQLEGRWTPIVDALRRRETMFPDAGNLVTFLALMRVRGPAFRDMIELQLAQIVHTEMAVLERAGEIEPPPMGLSPADIIVSIDPHRSLMAMAEGLKSIGELMETLHFDVLHNQTGTDFLTSDNPVLYFDPRVSFSRLRPYTVAGPFAPIELLFPIAPDMLLRGRLRPARTDIGHRRLTDASKVIRLNRLIARFGYRSVFARGPGQEQLISATADRSPVPEFSRIAHPQGGMVTMTQMAFGPRPAKPRWTPRDPD